MQTSIAEIQARPHPRLRGVVCVRGHRWETWKRK